MLEQLQLCTIDRVQCPFCGIGEDKPLGKENICTDGDLVEILQGFSLECPNCQKEYPLLEGGLVEIRITNHPVMPLGTLLERLEEGDVSPTEEPGYYKDSDGFGGYSLAELEAKRRLAQTPFNEGSAI